MTRPSPGGSLFVCTSRCAGTARPFAGSSRTLLARPAPPLVTSSANRLLISNRGSDNASTSEHSADVAELTATITCPACGHVATETMPTDRCQYFYECPSCKVVLKPKRGDCCVYCSYADRPCPSVQDGTLRDAAGSGCLRRAYVRRAGLRPGHQAGDFRARSRPAKPPLRSDPVRGFRP